MEIEIPAKECSICKEVKPLTEFHKRAASKDGHQNRCKACAVKIAGDWQRDNKEHLNATRRTRYWRDPELTRAKNRERSVGEWDRVKEEDPDRHERKRASKRNSFLKRLYGITSDDYDAMLEAQSGGCYVCGSPPRGGRQYLDVDHCHETGVVRGLLCNACNGALGLLNDDPTLMRLLADYVEQFTKNQND